MPSNRPVVSAIVTALAASACTPAQRSVTIWTDGRFDDWVDVPFIVADARDTPPDAAVDMLGIAVADDSAYLHLRLDVGRAVNAQALHGTIAMAFDADGNSRTGARLAALEGADLVVELSRQDSPSPSGFGLGMGYRLVGSEGLSPVRSGYDLALVAAPTFASDEFEIRLARGTPLAAGISAFTAARVAVQMVYTVDGDTVDITSVAHHAFASPYAPAEESTVAPPVRRPGTVRVLQWNVGETQLRDQTNAFARVIRAAEPDVLLLDEVFRDVQRSDIERLLEKAVPDVTTWSMVIGNSGGRQKTVVASRFPLRPEPRLAHVPYEPGSLDSLMRAMEDSLGARLIRVERESDVAAVGAWATVDQRDVLFVVLDLQSAGYDGSPQDRLRVLQALTIHQRIATALGSEPSVDQRVPLVIGGDFNLVGSRRPLDILQDSIVNAGLLQAAEPYHLGDRTQATWRDSRDVFTPGRLDFILYTPETLAVRQAFVFDVTALGDSVLGSLDVRRDDVLVTSNHLPVVVDLELTG